MSLDFGDRRPVTLRLRDALREMIATAELGPGDRLPSEAALAARFGVARGSVREALKHLEQEGLVDVRHGAGRFISAIGAISVNRPVTTFESVTEMLAGRGYVVRNVLLSVVRGVSEPAEAVELELEDGDEVVRLRRMRIHDSRVLVYSENVFASTLLERDELDPAAFAGSLNEWLAVRGRRPVSSVAALEATQLPSDVASQAGVGDEQHWLLITERCLDQAGNPVLLSRDYHRGSVFSFRVLRRVSA
jgi:GntR family transcriptional regulator